MFVGFTVAVVEGVATVSPFVFWEIQRFLLRRVETPIVSNHKILPVKVAEFCIFLSILFTLRLFLSTRQLSYLWPILQPFVAIFNTFRLWKLRAQDLSTELNTQKLPKSIQQGNTSEPTAIQLLYKFLWKTVNHYRAKSGPSFPREAVPLHDKEAYGGRGSIAPFILNLYARWRWVPSFKPWTLYSWWKASFPNERRLCVPHIRSGPFRGKYFLPLPGIEPGFFSYSA